MSKDCTTQHPALKLGGGTLIGGSCSMPRKADIYIGLDRYSMKMEGHYPWNDAPATAILFPIPDMSVPHAPESFVKMIGWLVERLAEGKVIHVGCIGGHGRTGLVVAALVSRILGEKDAITYARKHYCVRAVESSSQVAFLVQHFGVKAVGGTKGYSSSSSRVTTGSAWPKTRLAPSDYKGGTGLGYGGNGGYTYAGGSLYKPAPVTGRTWSTGAPMPVAGNIWDRPVKG